MAFDHFGNEIETFGKVLFLGVGIGSGISILEDRGTRPDYVVVDIDQTVLLLALQLQTEEVKKRLVPICIDALDYMASNTDKFNLVVVDIFFGRVVAPFVMSPDFLMRCKNSLHPGGALVINYIVHDQADWEIAQNRMNDLFPSCHLISSHINRVFIAKV